MGARFSFAGSFLLYLFIQRIYYHILYISGKSHQLIPFCNKIRLIWIFKIIFSRQRFIDSILCRIKRIIPYFIPNPFIIFSYYIPQNLKTSVRLPADLQPVKSGHAIASQVVSIIIYLPILYPGTQLIYLIAVRRFICRCCDPRRGTIRITWRWRSRFQPMISVAGCSFLAK